MNELKIIIDRLQDQKKICFDTDLNKNFIDLKEKDIQTNHEGHLKAEAYISGDYLTINYSLEITIEIRCKICNEFTPYKIKITNEYLTIEIDEIKNKIYDFQNDIKKAIILNIPNFIECNDNCKERENIKKYLKNNKEKKGKESKKFFPFENLK